MASETERETILRAVRERYAAAARSVLNEQDAICCSGSGCCGGRNEAATRAQSSCCGAATPTRADTIYAIGELQGIPDQAVLASLGCGNPLLLAELQPGEVVLDLGSGGGIDVLLSAKRVGPTGKAYGLDMTEEMLELARANARRAGATNVEFFQGQIEAIPLPDASVDVIISNCVINLSADKDAVLAEAFRVLKPGGRFAVADIVVLGSPLPEPVRNVMRLWVGCIAGALTEDEYRQKLAAAGFVAPEVIVFRTYDIEDMPAELRGSLPADLGLAPDTRVVSAFVRAQKPSAQTCCGGGCCS